MTMHTAVLVCAGILLLLLIFGIAQIVWLLRGIRETERNKQSARLTDHRYDPKQFRRRQ